MIKNFLGIDIGSVAISAAIVDAQGKVIQTYYDFHKGQIIKKLNEFFEKTDLKKLRAIAYTSSSPPIFKTGMSVDTRIAYITTAKYFYPKI